MKTVYTTLPIYKALRDQCVMRAKYNGANTSYSPVYTPKHRLPSFMWMDDGDGATTVTTIYLISSEDVTTDITSYFTTLPALYTSDDGIDYFIYNGGTLNYALPEGSAYLKIVMDSGHIYYSDWFTVDCVYCNFVKTFVNNSFDTFSISDTTISSCIDAGAGAYADSTPFQTVYQGQTITVMFFLTETGATNPTFSVRSTSLGLISNEVTSAAGLNELTLTVTSPAEDAFIRISTSGTTNFNTTEILVYTQYACGFVTLSFSNCCNLGDLLYEDDFIQTLWIHSDNIEQSYPYTEKGQENGDGRFIPTFRRQEKQYAIRTEILPQYMIDVLHRLKMHDVMTYIDQVGDTFNVESVDVEHEWFGDDKYFATATITLDLGEAVVAQGCC